MNIIDMPAIDIKASLVIGQIALKFFQESVFNSLMSNVIIKIVDRFK